MIRYKWFRAQGIPHFLQLQKSIESLSFSNDSDFGFDIRYQGDEALSGDCITKTTEVRRIDSPFGAPELIRFANYERTNFTIFRGRSELVLVRIESPPRSISNLIYALEKATGEKIYISSVELTYQLISQALSGLIFKMLSAELGNIVYGPSIIGSASIAATEGNSLVDFGLFARLPHRLEGFKAILISDTETARIAVSRSNVLTTRGALTPVILEKIENFIRKGLVN